MPSSPICVTCGQRVTRKQNSDSRTYVGGRPAVRHLEPQDCEPLTELQGMVATAKLVIAAARRMPAAEYDAFRDIVIRALDVQRV